MSKIWIKWESCTNTLFTVSRSTVMRSLSYCRWGVLLQFKTREKVCFREGFSFLFQMETGQIMTRSSSKTLTTRKKKYKRNIVNPSTLFILQLQTAMEIMTKSSMMKSSTMAQKSPLLLTATGPKPWMDAYSSQGTGRLLNETTVREKKVISQMVL